MFPSAAVWPQFLIKGFNLMVTVSQKQSVLLVTAGLLLTHDIAGYVLFRYFVLVALH